MSMRKVRGGGFPCLPWRPKTQPGAGAGAREVLPGTGVQGAGRAQCRGGAQHTSSL